MAAYFEYSPIPAPSPKGKGVEVIFKTTVTYHRLLLIAFALFFFSACDSNRVFDKNEDIPKSIWNKDFKPSFSVDIQDTSLLYNLYVNIRHTSFFPTSNLWILITTTFPDGKYFEKRVELELADIEGKWHGDCLGDICDLRLPIQQKAFFEQTGTHTFQFTQIMRVDDLPLVMSMGLRVEKAGPKESK